MSADRHLTSPALAAKLAPPRHGRIHPRPRLFRRLDAASKGGVVWVTGPPGSGKTVLVASWLARSRARPIWLQLDAGDADPAELFRWLTEAAPPPMRRSLPRFGPEHIGDPAAFARRFGRSMRSVARSGMVLVLDDWSAVGPDGPLHRVLGALIGELAGGVGVIATSRSGPPPALGRLRASRAMEVVNGPALAFTRAEARAVARLWGAASLLSSALVERAGGWAVAIALMAASRSGGVDGAVPKEVFDYLACEVFELLPSRVQRVLLRISLAPRIGAAAAARLGRDPGAPEILEELVRGGWFVQRHPGPEPAYEVHALVREYLATQARSSLGEDSFRALALETARVLEDGGHTAEAVALFRDTGAESEIARVVLTRAPRLVRAGAARTVADWIGLLRPGLVDGNPWLLHWRAAARLFTSPRDGLPDAEKAFEAFVRAGDATGAYLAWTGAVHLIMFGNEDSHAALDGWIDALGTLRARFEAWPSPEIESAVAAGAVFAYAFHRPQDPGFAPWLERAVRIALSSGDAGERLNAARHVFAWAGGLGADLERARVVLDAARPLVSDGRVQPLEAITWAVNEAFQRMHLGDAEGALAVAGHGLELGAQHGLDHWKGPLLSVRMLAELALDQPGRARTSFGRLAAVARRGGRLAQLGCLNSACTLALRTGAPRAAAEHGAAAVALAREAGSPFPAAVAHVQHALALERTGSPALGEAARFARETGQPHCEYGAHLAAATVALEREDEDGAAESAAAAFAISERTGGRSAAWLSRAEMAEVCALALRRGIARSVALDTIRACRLSPGPRARHLADWPWGTRIDSLGAFAVRRDGGERQQRKAQRKPRELLGLLVAHGERGAPPARLAEALWPDADGDVAHHALETTMYRLRRMLRDPASVVRRNGRVALDPARVFVDAWAFEDLCARAAAARARGDGAAALRAASEGIALYRGDLLPDDDLPAIAGARARLRARAHELGAPREP